MANTPTSHPASYHYEGNPYAYPQFAQQSTGSPLMSSPVGSHPRSPSVKLQDPPMLVASSSSTTTASTMTSSSVELLNDAFAKAMSLPEAFYPEFLQYSKDSYEQSTVNKSHDKKQRKWGDEDEDDQGSEVSNKEQENKTYVYYSRMQCDFNLNLYLIVKASLLQLSFVDKFISNLNKNEELK